MNIPIPRDQADKGVSDMNYCEKREILDDLNGAIWKNRKWPAVIAPLLVTQLSALGVNVNSEEYSPHVLQQTFHAAIMHAFYLFLIYKPLVSKNSEMREIRDKIEFYLDKEFGQEKEDALVSPNNGAIIYYKKGDDGVWDRTSDKFHDYLAYSRSKPLPKTHNPSAIRVIIEEKLGTQLQIFVRYFYDTKTHLARLFR